MFSRKLFGVCLKYSSNYVEAEDNLQDGFIQIFRTIVQFKNKGPFEAWAKRVMINNSLQKFRKTKHLELVSGEIPEIEDISIDEETFSMDFLIEIIQELPTRYRMVFNLFVLDNYSHQEISEMLEISVGTSKSNLSRARILLKEKIELAQKQVIIL